MLAIKNDSCAGLKLALTVVLCFVPLCTGCNTGPIVLYYNKNWNKMHQKEFAEELEEEIHFKLLAFIS